MIDQQSNHTKMPSNPTPYTLITFDWDGTLVDSEAGIVDSLTRALADLDLPPLPRTKLRDVIGLGLPEAVRRLLPGARPDLVERFIERYRLHYLSPERAPTRLFPGVRETLESLVEAGYLLAVATGKSRRGLERSMEETGCADLFLATRCADECFSKPHPQMLLELMDFAGAGPEETLMVGDTEYDLQMAANAGARALAVTYGVHGRERLRLHRPLGFLERIADILPWLGHGGTSVEVV